MRPPLNADDSVAVLRGADSLRILVAGGVGGLMVPLISGGRSWVTKKVELPAAWDKLVAKYADITPNYVRY